jgi:hypothetical protein
MTERDNPDPHQLAVDLADLADAIANNTQELAYFLDRETGAVILLTDEARREHEQLAAELGEVDRAQWAAAFEAALAASDVPEWERDMIRDADRVEAGLGERYLRVPEADGHADYADMEAFIETVPNARLRDQLSRAIAGRGAFRRFKDTLLAHPAERERWFAFSQARQRERALDWLRSTGLAPG